MRGARSAEASADESAEASADGDSPIRVLFVCTHNSARSIMAEALLRHHGGAAYEVHSAGIEPSVVRTLTLRTIEKAGLPTSGLRSRSVAEFKDREFDYVVTVCDSAQRRCPTFPGGGARLHWSHEDPSAANGSEAERLAVFERVFEGIEARVRRFVSEGSREA